ncbi:MAG: alkaline phosphatase family protein [Candidatus Marinimicrobia bacterium]|nr:alkaline phosphatase family protein [Candidatus Neomarinimicrobiota bacterium]MBL7009649.1 alkaline phosphatase family protein [Candidatus Neomarinimicrobiota bacterium]MBL7029608.1 alkaline phosphatase family protein [Candidatus Neomarinimicrobiota bacterium]
MKNLIVILFLLIIGCTDDPENQKGFHTENIILITMDGVRWEEVFFGADPNIITDSAMVKDLEGTHSEFWKEDANDRRQTLMPFLWKTIEKKGQVVGNKTKGSVMQLINPYLFSYPGYNELLTGFNDDSVNSNAKELNPNMNVLEFMNQQSGFENHVAAFSSWDVFDWIINNERNDFTINSGGFPLMDSILTPRQKWMNTFISDLPYPGYGTGVRWDVFTFEYAFEYLKLNKPRLLYIAFDETDEYAHQREYGKYLNAIQKLDSYIKQIWQWIQSQKHYRNKTTLIITTDHGRGKYIDGRWGSHGEDVPEAKYVWAAIIGPDTPSLGEITNADTISTNQIAATITHLLGYNYKSNQPVGKIIIKFIKPQ